MQSSCNHQMHDQPQLVFESNANSLTQPSQLNNSFRFRFGNSRSGGSHKQQGAKMKYVELVVKYPFFQRFDVDNDVGKFRHEGSYPDYRLTQKDKKANRPQLARITQIKDKRFTSHG